MIESTRKPYGPDQRQRLNHATEMLRERPNWASRLFIDAEGFPFSVDEFS